MKNKNEKSNEEFMQSIKSILLKKSEGYYYNEEVLEYQNKATPEEITNTQISFLDNINNEKDNRKQKDSNLTLIKKKITTHYIPPDMLAVKMLFEIFGEKIISSDLSNLSDSELNKIKHEIIDKLNEL